MFVDDETALANLAQAMLTRLGYDTEVYTSSRAALAAFQAAPQGFDLVITDQTMPHMTGEASPLPYVISGQISPSFSAQVLAIS